MSGAKPRTPPMIVFFFFKFILTIKGSAAGGLRVYVHIFSPSYTAIQVRLPPHLRQYHLGDRFCTLV